jgi:hypothetical protein
MTVVAAKSAAERIEKVWVQSKNWYFSVKSNHVHLKGYSALLKAILGFVPSGVSRGNMKGNANRFTLKAKFIDMDFIEADLDYCKAVVSTHFVDVYRLSPAAAKAAAERLVRVGKFLGPDSTVLFWTARASDKASISGLDAKAMVSTLLQSEIVERCTNRRRLHLGVRTSAEFAEVDVESCRAQVAKHLAGRMPTADIPRVVQGLVRVRRCLYDVDTSAFYAWTSSGLATSRPKQLIQALVGDVYYRSDLDESFGLDLTVAVTATAALTSAPPTETAMSEGSSARRKRSRRRQEAETEEAAAAAALMAVGRAEEEEEEEDHSDVPEEEEAAEEVDDTPLRSSHVKRVRALEEDVASLEVILAASQASREVMLRSCESAVTIAADAAGRDVTSTMMRRIVRDRGESFARGVSLRLILGRGG